MTPLEFGHFAGNLAGAHVDSWGAGNFLIAIEGKTYRFEDSDRFGPALTERNGDLLENPWPAERSPFWRAHRIWKRQGRRLETDGMTCIWDEPKPTKTRYIGGKNFEIIEHGEEDGKTIRLPAEGKV